MSTAKKEPREYTLHLLDGYFVEGVGLDNKNMVHVIEYSAYEELQHELREQITLRMAKAGGAKLANETALLIAVEENERLKAENTKLKEEFNKMFGLLKGE